MDVISFNTDPHHLCFSDSGVWISESWRMEFGIWLVSWNELCVVQVRLRGPFLDTIPYTI